MKERKILMERSDKNSLLLHTFWLSGFLIIVLLHCFWEILNQTPPVWDMAYHELMGWRFLEAIRDGNSVYSVSLLTDYYPPLYYFHLAFIIGYLGDTQFLAVLSSLPAMGLLSFATFRIASLCLGSLASLAAGWVVLLLPMVAWLSRVTLLDVPLAAAVAVAILTVIYSSHFQKPFWTFLFGICFAAGVLIKWTFLFFLITPVIYSLWMSPDKKKSLLHLTAAALISSPLALFWYWPNLSSLSHRFQVTSAQASWEQDPGVLNLLGWIYYPRSIASYYLFLPLTLVFVFSMYQIVKNRRHQPLIRFLVVSFVGMIIILSILPTKDPRYVVPVASILVVLLFSSLERWPRMIYGVLTVAFLQFLFCSFPTPIGRAKLALFSKAIDPDYTSVASEWVLLSNHYFDIFGPAQIQNWRHREISALLKEGDKVGFVPDAPFFNGGTLQLFTVRRGVPIQVRRLGNNPADADRLEGLDYVIGKTGSQGITVITRHNQDVYRRLEVLEWPVVREFSLPDAGTAVVYRNPDDINQ